MQLCGVVGFAFAMANSDAGSQTVRAGASLHGTDQATFQTGELTSTGERITPTAASRSRVINLNPDLPTMPAFTAGQASSLALSPDGKALLVLTSGYNRNFGADGKAIDALSHEYVFIYDVAAGMPTKQQVLMPENTFEGLDAWPMYRDDTGRLRSSAMCYRWLLFLHWR